VPETNLVHFEGALIPDAEAKISVLSPAFVRGPVAYETLQGYWSQDHDNLCLFRLHDHLRRLHASMRILRFQQIFSFEEITRWLFEVIRANGHREDMHARMLVYPLDEEGPARTSSRSGIVIDTERRPPRPRKPADVQVSSWIRRGGDSLPARVKAVGPKIFGRAALAQARIEGFSDLIFQDDRGRIAEAVSSNVFVVRHGVLATPAATDQILEGITRDTIIRLAGDLDIPCIERPIDRTELHDCEEAFLSSTGLEIRPIATVDGLPVGLAPERPITTTLHREYLAAARGGKESRRDWLTPVY